LGVRPVDPELRGPEAGRHPGKEPAEANDEALRCRARRDLPAARRRCAGGRPGDPRAAALGCERARRDVRGHLAAIAARCRFRDCSHGVEPGCAVREAISDGRIDAARVESHRKLALELARQAERREGGAARAERERWKAVSKELRRLSRERRR